MTRTTTLLMTLAIAALAATASGCATKTYGREGRVTEMERQTLTCREVDLEIAKVHGWLANVEKEAEFSGRDVLAFFGDLGIGNSLERSAALKSANDRLTELEAIRQQKTCASTSS